MKIIIEHFFVILQITGKMIFKIYTKRKYLVNWDMPSKVLVINVHKRRENIKFPVGK